MPLLQAEGWLQEARDGTRRLTGDGWYKLTLFVTGSKERAEKALYDYMVAEQNAGRKPQ